MKSRKVKVILITRPNVRHIMAECGCSQTTVYSALRHGTNSVQADKIRRLALQQYGGIETTKTVLLKAQETQQDYF